MRDSGGRILQQFVYNGETRLLDHLLQLFVKGTDNVATLCAACAAKDTSLGTRY